MRERATIPSRGARHQAHSGSPAAFRGTKRGGYGADCSPRDRRGEAAGPQRSPRRDAVRTCERRTRRRYVALRPTMPPMPTLTTYRGRRAASIENEHLRVTVLIGGGHLAEVHDKRAGVNPLWTPPWPSIEPAQYDPRGIRNTAAPWSRACWPGIMGHNLCLDIFGGPSEDEARAGLPVHGEVVDRRLRRQRRRGRDRDAGRPAAGGSGGGAPARAAGARRLDPRNGAQPGRRRQAGGVDRARDARPAVSRERADPVPRVGRPLPGLRVAVRRRRLPADRRRFRLAARAAPVAAAPRTCGCSPTRPSRAHIRLT